MSDDEQAEKEEVVKELDEEEDRKPGQKFMKPSPGFADRVFYESLLQQRPDSHMAQEWCVQYGILEYDEAAKLYRAICKRKGKPEYIKPENKGSSKGSNGSPTKKKKSSHTVVDGSSVVAETGLELGTGVESLGASAY